MRRWSMHMAENGQPGDSPEVRRTQALVHRSRWPGWIWLVPLIAVAILVWLGARYFLERGATATVLFEDVTGVSPENTAVTYRGVQIGKVSKLALSADGRQVRVTLALDHAAVPYLRSGTRFWLQGASFNNPATLGAVIAGPTVEMEPGPGAPQRTFIGLSKPPAFTTPVAGTHFTLTAAQRGSLQQGAGVYYLGLEVGKVLDVQMSSPHQFRFQVLVRSPYDHLVHRGSRFWDAGALQVSLASGLQLQLLSTAALLEGAVAFATSSEAAEQPRGADGEVFQLYSSEQSAQLAPTGPYALYRILFAGSVGALEVGAPVKLRDFEVGQVREVNFELDPDTGALRTPVTIELDADRLHLADGGATAGTDWTPRLNDALARLVRAGLRAQIDQSPELIGSYYVALDFIRGARAAHLLTSSNPPQIPAAPGGGLGALATELSQLPLTEIGANVRQITEHVRTLVSSPQLEDSLQHLDATLTTVDTMTHAAAPQIQPLIANLRAAAGQLLGVAAAAHQALGGADEQGGMDAAVEEMTRAARSVRVLADYLERHPEAILTGKR
jgi:paraquat-inducible protein B